MDLTTQVHSYVITSVITFCQAISQRPSGDRRSIVLPAMAMPNVVDGTPELALN